jgi:hypothetical protein
MILCVKGILTTKCGVWSRCLSSGVNIIYNELKSSIFFEVDILCISGRSACSYHHSYFVYNLKIFLQKFLIYGKSRFVPFCPQIENLNLSYGCCMDNAFIYKLAIFFCLSAIIFFITPISALTA